VAPTEKALKRMCDTIIHRGPDQGGYHICDTGECDFQVNIGARRLAIIDVDHGDQPVPGGCCVLSFNGEIYNHRELRVELEREGLPCVTHCDTEVVHKLWSLHGANCLDRLDGMFAFVVWDAHEECVYLVRDRMGKKPAFFYWEPDINLFVCASELKAIVAHPYYTTALSVQGLYNYLQMQYVPEPRTAFRDIAALPPGHMIEYRPRKGVMEKKQWWQLRAEQTPDHGAAMSHVRETVTDAIIKRLESDVPLGVYLSGGIDSSLITAIASQNLSQLHTFTIGFENPRYDESHWAEKVAALYQTHHTTVRIGEPDIGQLAREIVGIYDQPFGDCSAIPTVLLARESKRAGLTVALTGDGGDEAFGGYERYRTVRPDEGIYSYFRWLSVWQSTEIPRLMNMSVTPAINNQEVDLWLSNIAMGYSYPDVQNRMAWIDTHSYLVGDIITKMERATMSTSIEARCPFLDSAVFELAFSIPAHMKMHRTWTKIPLRSAFDDLLPDDLWNRRKMGFGVPIGDWLRTPHGRQLLAETLLGKEHWIFDGSVIRSITEQHLNGGPDRGHGLWVLIMAYLWLQRHFG
jgi:asparagine synthase (glutamine-hydrolysing)